ncbi:MAG TPA: hypothetical protein VL793_16720 [Patescibacteria group bacterium]|jgi:hypothetical protein|nr:hypothetical protein [Patescibacteria group bacterium]
MKRTTRAAWVALGLMLLWRLAMLLLVAQPMPANDAFFFDGAVINWLRHGHYCNPSLSAAYTISAHQVFAAYPPFYQLPLLGWMWGFGTSALSEMWLHFALFCAYAVLAVALVRRFFPEQVSYALAALFLFGITWCERPDDLAHIFGMAALWLIARQLGAKNPGWASKLGIALLLFAALYTSPVGGAYYFGIGALAQGFAWWLARRRISIVAYALAAVFFAGATFAIAKTHPLWWQGFQENARRLSIGSGGHALHFPEVNDLIKLARQAPVFLLFLAVCPLLWKQRDRLRANASEGHLAWIALTLGIAAMGTGLFAVVAFLLAPNYVIYVLPSQVVLAAGLLAIGEQLEFMPRRWLRGVLTASVLFVSIRAVGLTTWGAACARDISYRRSCEIVRQELQPVANTQTPVILSSAFLYAAAELGVTNALHADWVHDHRRMGPDPDLDALQKLRSPKLILTQFDFYRNYPRTIERLCQHPELVLVRVRDTTRTRTPDSIPRFQRVLQHVSWAPVIVELDWR